MYPVVRRMEKTYFFAHTLDERPEFILSIAQGTLPWKPVLWAKSTSVLHLSTLGTHDIR